MGAAAKASRRSFGGLALGMKTVGGAAFLYFWCTKWLAGAGAVRRWAHRREADRDALGRRFASRNIGSNRRSERFAAPQASRRLSAPERAGAGLARDRSHRTLTVHARLVELPALRRQATVELNKGEARNALTRAVCFHRLGRLRDRAAEALQYRASGLALVTAAIALWNTVYLGRALDELRRGGEFIPDTLLTHLAPVGWQHINLTGDYLWDAETGLAPDGFRPLRVRAAIAAHAA
jgi:hypothetical protein